MLMEASGSGDGAGARRSRFSLLPPAAAIRDERVQGDLLRFALRPAWKCRCPDKDCLTASGCGNCGVRIISSWVDSEGVLYATSQRPFYFDNLLLSIGLTVASFLFVQRYLPRGRTSAGWRF